VNDQVLDANGQKMSKSRGNTVDPWEVIGRHGVDAVRLFFLAASQVWVPRRFDEEAIRETAGRFLVTLRNVYGFFALYANFGWAPSSDDPPVAERPLEDRWVLSRLATVSRDADRMLGDFDATGAARLLMSFLTDDVSNWYVRQTRARYWAPDGAIDRAAFATLHEVLVQLCRLLAPLAPFVSDWMHRELTGESVHLADYLGPAADERRRDPALERAMAEVRELARLGRAAREEAGLKVRQPLARLVCVVPSDTPDVVRELFPLLATELNVRQVELATSADALVTLEAKPNFRMLGRKFGKRTPEVAAAVGALPADALRALERGEPASVTVGTDVVSVVLEDVAVVRRASGELVVQEAAGRFAAVDPTVTAELRREGLAREFVSRVQRMRRDAGLEVSDRVLLWADGDAAALEALRDHRAWVAGEVLAREFDAGAIPAERVDVARTVDLDGLTVRVALIKE
jgi:isoleucyl-tRNA synthetase